MTLSVNGIRKKFANFKLGPINLEIPDKEPFVLLGSTGSGKTSFLEVIGGFIQPDEGKLVFNGKDITFANPEERNVGLVYQDYQLFPHMGVFKNLAYGLKLRGKARPEIDREVRSIARKLKIEHLLGRSVKNLSGGEKQRIALGRALVTSPEILLLDEPFSAIDELMRRELLEEFKDLMKELQCLSILVTHNQEEAYELGHSIGILHNGSLLETGEKNDIFRSPKSKRAAQFLGFRNIFPGKRLQEIGVGVSNSSNWYAIPNEAIYIQNLDPDIETFEVDLQKLEILRSRVRVQVDLKGLTLEYVGTEIGALNGKQMKLQIDTDKVIPLQN